jgi:hypothetical protein
MVGEIDNRAVSDVAAVYRKNYLVMEEPSIAIRN